MNLDDLTDHLETHCHALEQVAESLNDELAVLAVGNHHLLPAASEVVEKSLASLRDADSRRCALTEIVCHALGLVYPATLEDIAMALEAHDPLRAETLRSLRSAMRSRLEEVQALLTRTRMVLARNLAATADALALLGVSLTAGTTGSGSRFGGNNRSWLVDTRG